MWENGTVPKDGFGALTWGLDPNPGQLPGRSPQPPRQGYNLHRKNRAGSLELTGDLQGVSQHLIFQVTHYSFWAGPYILNTTLPLVGAGASPPPQPCASSTGCQRNPGQGCNVVVGLAREQLLAVSLHSLSSSVPKSHGTWPDTPSITLPGEGCQLPYHGQHLSPGSAFPGHSPRMQESHLLPKAQLIRSSVSGR